MTSTPAYLRLDPNGPLPYIELSRWFRAIVVLDAKYSDDWQMEVSRWLVDAGCLYMMAWGPDCGTWDDSVDYALILKYLPDEAPEKEFIMTTWHENESLEDVFWFCQFNAFDTFNQITNTLIVHIGEHDRKEEFLKLFDDSKTLAQREIGEG